MTDPNRPASPVAESIVAPVVATIQLDVEPTRAFEAFAGEIGSWWPLETFSIAADEELGVHAVDVRVEGRSGGRIVEVRSDGSEVGWGSVLAWEPPHRLVLAWNPSSTRTTTTDVEVTFTSVPGGTLVRLEHRGWERLGDVAATARASYEAGWPRVLGRYAESTGSV